MLLFLVAYSNERKLPPDDEAGLVSRTSQRQLLNLKKSQYQQSPATKNKQPKVKKQAPKKSLRPRFEQAFSLVDNKQQNDVKRHLNKTVRIRSKASSQHHHVAATVAAARSQFARVKKNSLTRNFYNTIGVRNNCTRQVCFPPIGNLLIGRRNFLFASSTCGLENAERFCILGEIKMKFS